MVPRLFAGLLGAMALFVFIGTWKMSDQEAFGASFIPRVWSGLLLLVGALLAIRKPEEVAKSSSGSLRRLFILVALLAFYLGGVHYLGYFPSTLLFLPLAMLYLRGANYKVVAAVTVGWLLFAYLVFQKALHISLPPGLLWE